AKRNTTTGEQRTGEESAAKNKPAAAARVAAIAGSTTCGVRPTRSISQASCRSRRESSSAQARGAGQRSNSRCHPERSAAESKDPVAEVDVYIAGSLDFARDDEVLRRDRQCEKLIEFFRTIQIHDALSQFFALLFPHPIDQPDGHAIRE